MMRTLFFAVWIAYIARLYGLYTYHCHFFPSILTEGFRPLHLSRISLSIKISVAFWSAKLKCFRIIADKRDTVSRIHRTRTEVAIANSHFAKLMELVKQLPQIILPLIEAVEVTLDVFPLHNSVLLYSGRCGDYWMVSSSLCESKHSDSAG